MAIKDIYSFASSVVLYSSPLLYVSIGVLILELAGVVHMASEGILLISAQAAIVCTYLTNNVWIGMLGAIVVAVGAGVIFTWLTLEFKVNQTVLGIAFNLIGAGLTTTLNRAFKIDAITVKSSFPKGPLGVPIPVYLGVILVVVVWIILQRTKAGLRLRTVGEAPEVAKAMGISVYKVRITAAIVSSVFVGMGGSLLSTCLLSKFTENMSGGRGFFALGAVTFGRYTPLGTLIGVLIFGTGETLSYRLQVGGGMIPYEFALMLPYILIIIALCMFSRHSHDPKALGMPFDKENK